MKITMRSFTFKILTPTIAGVCLGLLPEGAQAQTPVFDATFPASWSGTGTAVTDQSSAGSIGYQSGTATYETTTLPAGGTGGAMALTGAGGIKVTGNGTTFPTDAILNNTAVAADGGFTYNIDFLWNGTASPATQKLIDYAGVESLQLTSLTANSSATLGMAFGTGNGSADTGGTDVDVISTTILPNTWYDVTMTFNTQGNSIVGGDISGLASLYINGSLVSSAETTKGTYGDSLNRPIAIGELAYGHTTSILGLTGDIYSASVDLGVVAPVPEPSTLALSAMGGLSGLAMILKGRRRKA
jgi:hypothetical protein